MFLDNDKKILCLSVPKTASQTCSRFFREHIKLSHGSYIKIGHLTVNDLISRGMLRYNISEYQIYGIVRCPLQRFLSSINHLDTFEGYRCNTVEQLIMFGEEILSDKKFNEMRVKYEILFRKQIEWLKVEESTNLNVYKFDNVDKFVNKICDLYDIDFNNYLKFDRIHVGKIKVSVDDLGYRMKKTILQNYSEDKVLYDSIVEV